MSLQEREVASINRQQTDLESHHIEGYAAMAPHLGRFSVPLISHVAGNLWQGGCLGGVKLPDDFKYVVSLYPWEQYELGPDTERVEYTLYDSGDEPDAEEILSIAKQAYKFAKEGKTLVHCQAGLNRSGLISALVLMLGGLPAEDAIDQLREQRCSAVLCNSGFEHFLRNVEL